MSGSWEIQDRLEAHARYNVWEKEQIYEDTDGSAERLAWLADAYQMAQRFGALRPLPKNNEDWLREVHGIMLMRERLAVLGHG